MCEKCYELQYLQKYQNNIFIYERKTINGENIFTYKAILQETENLIKSFHAYKIENHVGFAIDVKEHSPAICVLLLGILNHNCYFFSLDLGDIKNAENYLKSSGVKYVVSPSKGGHNSELFEKEAEEIIIFNDIFYIKTLKPTIKHFRNVNLCYTIATSGSTGQPKMVHVPYDCLKPNIVSLSSLFNIHPEDIIFLSSPPTFDPFVVEFFMALMNGTALLITTNEIRLQPQTLIEILFPGKRSLMKGITIYQTTPSLFRRFGTDNIKNILNENTSLKCLILGGEEFPTLSEICKWMPLVFNAYGKRIFNIYGITEVSCWSSIYEFTANDCLKQLENVPIGKPLDDFTYFRICDDMGHVVPFKACKGELEIGSSVRHCFIPEYDGENIKILETQEIIYRKTGDFVERDELGNIFYRGRTNNTIKRMGKRICMDTLSKKIEKLLNTTLLSFKVVALCPKETMKLIFYISNTPEITEEHKRSVQRVIKHNLENYERPDEIIYSIEPLPLTEHGKIDRFRISREITKNKQFKTPILIFKDFITNLLGLNIDITSTDLGHDKKRFKTATDVSFIAAGGTSFQALSLAAELTENMENPNDQRTILEMLLDNKVGINKILEYLETCALKTPQTIGLTLPIKNPKDLKLTFKLMWHSDLKKCIDASPTIYEDSFIAVGSHSHLLVVADARTGRQISMLELPDRIECPVVFVSSKLAVVGCYDGLLYGFDFNKGSIRWKINVKGMIKAKPLVVKDSIIVASYAEEYNVAAYDLKTLALKWHIKFGTKGIFSSPVYISEEFVSLCCLDGSYGLIEIENGSLKWQKKLDSPIFATASTIKTHTEQLLLILAEVKGQVTICKAETGEKVTSFQAEGNIFSGFQLYKRDAQNILIIFGCHDKNVYCLNFEVVAEKLNLIWKYFMHAPVFSTPIRVAYGYTLCCSTKGMLVVLGVNNADLMATHNLNAEVFSTPICLKDKFVYLGARDNNLYAFELV